MFFKNWPYWLKGGVILGSVSLLAAMVLFAGNMLPNVLEAARYSAFGDILRIIFMVSMLLVPVSIITSIDLGMRGSQYAPSLSEVIYKTSISSLISIIIMFIIGSIIGLIYGKIKRRTKN